MIFKKKGREIKEKQYTHVYNQEEANKIKSIINKYNLDSVSLYEQRITNWGYVWDIRIKRASITFDISLPNYHNQGLEELLSFARGLIPRRKKNTFTR